MKDEMNEGLIGMLQMDGYDDCVVGTVTRFGMSPVLCYDLHKVIAKMVADGMDEEEAYDVALKAHGCWTLDDDYDCNSDYFEIGNIKEEEEDGQ